jgi:hypothetical protein
MPKIDFELDENVVRMFPGGGIDDLYGTEYWDEFSRLVTTVDNYKWKTIKVVTKMGDFGFIAVIDKSK